MPPSKYDPSSGTSTPKIAIKGFSLSSKSSSSSKPGVKPKPTAPSSSLGKRPRSTFATHDDSGSDSEDGFGGGRNGKGRHEVVTGFGEGGAIQKSDERKREKEVLVIPRMENRDWRGSKAKGKNLLPPEVQREREAKARAEEEGGGKRTKVEEVDTVNSNDGEIKWGLSVRKRERSVEDDAVDEKEGGREPEKDAPREEEKQTPQTADQEALSALLGTAPEKKGPDLVIPTPLNTNEPKLSEEDAYKRSIAAAPDVSTLEDYERVPVEEFGAALLRGMGWKGEKVGKVRDVKRRQNLLGLGARELKDAEELGAWVQKSDVKRLNEKRGGGKGGTERRPKVSEYAREKERRDERREERGGGGYRREQDRERERDRDYRRDGDRERDRRR